MVRILSVIQEIHGSAAPFSQRSGIVFIGSFPHHPNADAMRHFLDDLYPALDGHPAAEQVTIVGPEPPDWLRARADDRLKVLGYVSDIKPIFDRTKLSFAPLRYGAGVNGKVLLSMSYGVPVVASSVAAEGLPAVEGIDISIADDPAAFRRAITDLYDNAAMWTRRSDNGLRLVERHYSIPAGHHRLVEILADLGLD
jgi:glycosyltransferase involved in cell wall biosynthesis